MSTQVSWIEPEQLRALVGQLQGSAGDNDRSAWEVHTLPGEMGLGARDLGIPDDDLWLPNEISPALEPEEDVNAFLQTEPTPSFQLPETDSTEDEAEYEPIQPNERLSYDPQKDEAPVELNRIRQKLQAIREKAIEAGLLAHLPAPEEVTPVAVETPAPVVAAPETTMNLDGPDPVGDTGPLEQDSYSSPPLTSTRISSPFSVAEESHSPLRPVAPGGVSFVVPEGSIMQRLNAYAEWASAHLHTRELIIADDHGDVLWGDHAQSGLLVSTMMASKAALRSTALGACDPQSLIEQSVSPGRTLIVVPCETQFGTLSVALIRAFSISGSDAMLLRKNINIAVDGGARTGSSIGEIV
jgi:hypothetical protein